MILGKFEYSVRHRRSAQSDECKAGKHLPEVVIGAMQRALDVAQDRVDPGERRMLGACWSTSGHKRGVNTPCVSYGTKAAQSVGNDHSAGLEVTPGPGRDLVASKPTDTAQAHPHRPVLTIEFIDANLGHLKEDLVRKIVCENTARLYRI